MSDPFRLDGKIALVTGACGAIGSATATMFVARGARVIAVDRPGSDFSALDTVLNVAADVTDEAAVRDYVAKAIDAAGRIDIFFSNAGVEGPVMPIQDYAFADFRRVFAVNVDGIFLGMKYVVPVMLAQSSGSIINTSSVAGMAGSPGMAAYVASKHAVIGLTRVVAKEVAAHGIRVNCVNPGPITGRMMTSLDEEAGIKPDARAQFIPAKRYGNADEVAATVAFLASDAARYVTGAIHPVDGGLTA